MAVFDEETERVINSAVERAFDKYRRKSDEDMERAVGFYYEKTKDDFDRLNEALDSIKLQTDKIPDMLDDIAELKSDMHVVKLAVRDTNRELHGFNA